MFPLLKQSWPSEAMALFTEINELRREGKIMAMKHKCGLIEASLKRLDKPSSSRKVRLQVARTYYDLSFVYRELGKSHAARLALEKARDRWIQVLKHKPGDFYARTQLGLVTTILDLWQSRKAKKAWLKNIILQH